MSKKTQTTQHKTMKILSIIYRCWNKRFFLF